MRAAAAIGVVLLALLGACREADVSVLQVDTSARFQTWQAWQAAISGYHVDDPTLGDEHPVPQAILDQVLDEAVDALGVTALRQSVFMQLAQGRAGMEASNDNDDPHVLNSAAFRWHWIDPYIRNVVLPFKQRVEASGQRFSYTFQLIAWDAWQWHDPQEYAEFVIACLERMRTRFGLVPDYLSPYNEPDLGEIGPAQVIPAVTELIARMDGAGFDIPLAFPEISRIENADTWLDALERDAPQLLSRLGRLSFHLYGVQDDALKRKLRERARRWGVPTAQTELWKTRHHPRAIHAALTQADAVVYEPFVLSHASEIPNPGDGYTFDLAGGDYPRYEFRGIRRGPNWEVIRQYARCVRPGSVRVEVTSLDPDLLPIGFVDSKARLCIVVHNRGELTKRVDVAALPAARYSAALVDSDRASRELSPVDIAHGGKAYVAIPEASTLSLIPVER